MNSNPLRVALIGAGGIGKVWTAAAQKTNKVIFVAVVDTDEARAASLAGEFPGCRALTDWNPLLADPSIDAFLVATPHNLLAPISHAALSAGKHVLVEKPTGISTEEVQKNIEVAYKKNLVYMPGFNHRYHPAFMEAKKLFDEGAIGSLNFIRARYGFGGRPGYEKEWRFNKVIAGGGEFIDQGMHMIDMARWFMGEIETVRGMAENFFWGGEVEDNGFALLRTKDRKVASIHVSWTNWDWIHSFEIFGSGGYMRVEGLDSRYHGPEKFIIGTHDPRSGKFPEEKIVIFDKEKKEDSLMREIEAFAEAVGGGNKKIPKGEDAVAVLKIVEEIYKNNG